MRTLFTHLLLLFGGMLFFSNSALAQQLPMSSLYSQNRFMINPASAGYEDGLVAHLNFRNQWAGVKGSPTTGWLSLHSPIGKNTNIGGIASYDKTDFISTVNIQLAYAHNIKLTKEHFLSLGLSAGVNSVSFNLDEAVVENASDAILANGNVASTTVALDFGLRYHWKGLEVGAAAPNILGNVGELKGKDNTFKYDINRHYRFYASYEMMIKNIFIAPYGMVRFLPNTPVSWDVAVKAGYKRIVWASFMWRAETGPVAGVGFKVADKFSFAYAYDFTLNGLDNSPWSNEIMVSFHLDGFKKKLKKMEERMDVMEQGNLALASRMDSLQMALSAKMDSLSNDVNVIREQDLVRIQEDIDRLTKEIEDMGKSKVDTGDLKGLLQRITPVLDSAGNLSMTSENLESGYYVVIESFRSLDNANRGVEIWKKKNREAIIVYDEERKWYYVYSQRFGTDKEARKEMRATRKADVPDAWVHKYRVF